MSAQPTTTASEVHAEDFADILAATRDYIRTVVVPREQEIADTDAIPDDIRAGLADMGLFGYAIPQQWGGLGLDLTQDVELAMSPGVLTGFLAWLEAAPPGTGYRRAG